MATRDLILFLLLPFVALTQNEDSFIPMVFKDCYSSESASLSQYQGDLDRIKCLQYHIARAGFNNGMVNLIDLLQLHISLTNPGNGQSLSSFTTLPSQLDIRNPQSEVQDTDLMKDQTGLSTLPSFISVISRDLIQRIKRAAGDTAPGVIGNTKLSNLPISSGSISDVLGLPEHLKGARAPIRNRGYSASDAITDPRTVNVGLKSANAAKNSPNVTNDSIPLNLKNTGKQNIEKPKKNRKTWQKRRQNKGFNRNQ